MIAQKFVLVNEDYDTYKLGEIVGEPAPGHYLVKFDCLSGDAPRMPSYLFSVEEMIRTRDEGLKDWNFFDTPEDRRAWLDWVKTTSEKSDVVNLVN